MAISDKLTYLNDTKTLIREGLNNLGADLTTQDTFRSYATALDNIYDELPKVSGTGTNILLSPTKKGKMTLNLAPSELEQDTTTGKNIWNFNTLLDDWHLTSKTTNLVDNELELIGTNNTGAQYAAYRVNCKENTTYTLSRTLTIKSGTSTGSIGMIYIYAGNTYLTNMSRTETHKTFTIPSGTNFIKLQFLAQDVGTPTGTLDIVFSNVQIEEGSSASSFEPYTGGIPAPNPDYPQDVHTISGNNEIVVKTLNMVKNGNLSNNDTNWTKTARWSIVEENGIKYAKLVISSADFDQIYQQLETINEHKYYISALIKQNTKLNAQQVIMLSANPTSNYPFPNFTIPYNTTETLVSGIIQATADNAYIGIKTQYYNQTGEITLYARNFLCIDLTELYGSGNEPTKEQCDALFSYVEYSRQNAPLNLGTEEYCKIGNYADEFIKTSGKNLFDKNSVENDKRLDSNGQLISNSASGFSTTNYIKVLPNTKYTYSRNTTSSTYYVNISEYTSDKTHIQRLYSVGDTTTTYKFTTPNNCEYLRINDATSNLNSIQLEIGETATSYEPYGTNEWYLKKNIGKVVLDGSENWTTNASWNYTNTNGFIYALGNTNTNLLSNYFVKSNVAFSSDTNGLMGIVWSNQILLRIDNTLASDTNAFKTWLSTHNTIVYYVLSSPTYTLLDDTLQEQLEHIASGLLSYSPQTNISQVNNDLPFVITANALLKSNS